VIKNEIQQKDLTIQISGIFHYKAMTGSDINRCGEKGKIHLLNFGHKRLEFTIM
jgi:hypothetical protein